jgi:eukaryotic-like serine/threonine-protein kinase
MSSDSAADRFRRADALFAAALELPDAERARWVEAECAGDADLCRDVLDLLATHDRALGFLEQPPAALMADALDSATPASVDGSCVGPYRIERELGRGGMGVVYLAARRDPDLPQSVALKLLPPTLRTDGFVHRFVAERRILAGLEHANIARLVDGGVTPDGTPYFAMEFVEGERIDDYCRRRDLPLHDRLRLFNDACAAVQYAHQRLVVHRDLKPANILVTPAGIVKLLDFGIAKLLAADEGETRTRTGLRLLTLEYAAPEQLRGDEVSTAADVYSLGVILYELIVGRRPIVEKGLTAERLENLLTTRQLQPPSSAVRAEGRRTRVPPDLDTIVMTALQPEPVRRYGSAAALQEDLLRFQRGLPIRARPDTLTYRTRRWIGRNRALAAGLATVLLLAPAIAAREYTLRREAEGQARRAEAVKDFLIDVFDASDPFAPSLAGADVTARALLDRGAERVNVGLAAQPDVQAEMMGVLGRVYGNLGLYDDAEPLLRRSLGERRHAYGAAHPSVAEAMDALGGLLVALGRHDEAEPLLREALALRRRAFGDRHALVAQSVDRVATLLQEKSDYAGAEPLFREALAIRRAVHGPEHADVAASLHNLGLLLWWKSDYAAAEQMYREALAVRSAVLGPRAVLTSQTMHNLAQTLHLAGNLDDAESLFRESLAIKREALGDAHPSVTVNINNIARVLRERGRLDEAETLAREALALDRRIFGAEHPSVAASMDQLASVLRLRGSLAEAEELFREVLAMQRRLRRDPHSHIALALNNLAGVLHVRGQFAAADTLFAAALDQYRTIFGADHLFPLTVSVSRARSLRDAGRNAEAEALFRSALPELRVRGKPAAAQFVLASTGLGQSLLALERDAEALPVLEAGRVAADGDLTADDWRRGEAMLALAEAYIASGRAADARPLLTAAMTILAPHQAAQPLLSDRVRRAARALSPAPRGSNRSVSAR